MLGVFLIDIYSVFFEFLADKLLLAIMFNSSSGVSSK